MSLLVDLRGWLSKRHVVVALKSMFKENILPKTHRTHTLGSRRELLDLAQTGSVWLQ